MTTIRRNAHKKIAKLVKDAVRVQSYDHSGPEPKRTIDAEHVDAVLEDWFEWTREGCGSAWIHNGTRYVTGPDGRHVPGMVVDVKALVLAYHQNRGLEAILEEGEPRESR